VSRRKGKAEPIEQPLLTLFPSFSLRQAHILMQCVALGMTEGVLVDGVFVGHGEWEAIIKQLIRH
jgi:hypothetical protein